MILTVMKNPKEQVKVLQHIRMLALGTTDIPILSEISLRMCNTSLRVKLIIEEPACLH